MLIPHLHFGGECKDAIRLYEQAFESKVQNIEYMEDGNSIAHASMYIHKQKVYLNDNFGNNDKEYNCRALHLILTFPDATSLIKCYEILKPENVEEFPFVKLDHSELGGNFLDRYGVLWGFMVTSD